MLNRFNHTANAELVSELTQGNLRFDANTEKWYFWDNDWIEEKYVDEFIRKAAVYRELRVDAVPEIRQKEAKQWANGSFNKYHIDATREVMQRMGKFALPESDENTMLFKTTDKVIDLRTLKVRNVNRDDGMVTGSRVVYNPEARAPVWRGVLHDAFHDKDLEHYFQKIGGYLLTAETSEQVFFHLVGVPGSGKSKIMNALNNLLGDYAYSTDFRSFAKSRFENSIINHELAPMKGKRLVTTTEPSKNDKWDDKTLKTITGEDTITCRFMRKEEFQYTPQFKVFVMSNWRIYTDDLSGAFDRRYIPIPFDVSYTQDSARTQDYNLDKKLHAELSGILNWALEGCKMWQEEGLKDIPAVISSGREEQKADNRANVFGGVHQFAEECLTKTNLTYLSSTQIYAAYTRWASEIGIPAHSILGGPNKVSEVLREIGFAPYRSNSMRGFWAEIKVDWANKRI